MHTTNERDNLLENQTEAEKRWNYLEQILERLGVENGIKELAVGLNLHGYRTMFSCEGHPAYEPIVEGDSRTYAKWRPAYIVFNFKTDSEKVKGVEGLIEVFYQNRPINEETKLCIRSYTKGYAWLTAQTFDRVGIIANQKESAKEISEAYLSRQQDEMKAFSDFLKSKYFHSQR